MINSSLSRRSLANTSRIRQTIREEDRLNAARKHSWVKTFLMTNPITAPVVLLQEVFVKR